GSSFNKPGKCWWEASANRVDNKISHWERLPGVESYRLDGSVLQTAQCCRDDLFGVSPMRAKREVWQRDQKGCSAVSGSQRDGADGEGVATEDSRFKARLHALEQQAESRIVFLYVQ